MYQIRESIEQLYAWLLHRKPTDDEVDTWEAECRKGLSFGKMTSLFLRSEEFLGIREGISNQSILHMHLEKCSGSTFREWLNQFIPRNRTYVYGVDCVSKLEHAQLATGHFSLPFAACRAYDVKATVLRDPVERIVSLYRFARSDVPSFPMDDPARLLNFQDWICLKTPDVLNLIDNLYVRRVTGLFVDSDGTDPMRDMARDALQVAQAQYQGFDFVGDQSDLSVFYDSFSSFYNLPKMSEILRSQYNENVAERHEARYARYPPRPEMSQATLDRLAELTAFDWQIYERYRVPGNVPRPGGAGAAAAVSLVEPGCLPSSAGTSRHDPLVRIRFGKVAVSTQGRVGVVYEVDNLSRRALGTDSTPPLSVGCQILDRHWNLVDYFCGALEVPGRRIPASGRAVLSGEVGLPLAQGTFHLVPVLLRGEHPASEFLLGDSVTIELPVLS